jgi:hypothetical protein
MSLLESERPVPRESRFYDAKFGAARSRTGSALNGAHAAAFIALI